MRKAFLLTPVVVLIFAGYGWTAGARGANRPPVAATQAMPKWMQDLSRNVALGTELEGKPGTNAQYQELQSLADRGLKAARDLAAKDPSNAEAQYALGSWLIYGYRVVGTAATTADTSGETRTETTRTVGKGLSGDPQEGLNALRRAVELAPAKAQYTLDYAAALLDTDRPDQSVGILQAAWQGKPQLTTEEKMRAGVMLSDAYAAQDRPDDARHWLYSTLLLNPQNAEIVKRLEDLDTLLSAQPIPPAELVPTTPVPAPEAAPEEETPPSEEEAAPAPAPEQPGDEAAPETQPAPGDEAGPGAEQGGGEEAAPEGSGGTPSGQEAAPQNGGDEGTGEDTVIQIPGEEAGA